MDGDGVGVQRGAGARGKEAGMAEDGLSDLTLTASLSERSDQPTASGDQHLSWSPGARR